MSVKEKIKNSNCYPQCNSFDPDTIIPEPVLQDRLNQYQKELDFDNWNPRTLLDIGAGKGYFLHHWKSVKESQAVEFIEHIKLPENCKLYKCKFLDAVGLLPADVVLALRVSHYNFMETYSQLYLVKIAMLCKTHFLWESLTDLTKTDLAGIKIPLDRAVKEWQHRGDDATADRFWEMANLFFEPVKQFNCPFLHYDTIHFKRKLPPIERVTTINDNQQRGQVWYKYHNETQVMEYLTCCQLLGKTDHILSLLQDSNGTYVGFKMKHLTDKQTLAQRKTSCKLLFADLAAKLLPIGYIPVDIVPQNVINNVPIDISMVQSCHIKFSEDDFRNQILKNDIILHHNQLK